MFTQIERIERSERLYIEPNNKYKGLSEAKDFILYTLFEIESIERSEMISILMFMVNHN
jgi:hypothetical protein